MFDITKLNLFILVVVTTGLCSLSSDVLADTKRAAEMVKDGEIVAEPKPGAALVTQLQKDQSVEVQSRTRAWYQVQTEAGDNGWVKMLMLRFIGDAKRDSELGVTAAWQSVSGAKSERTLSTGIRGFDEEDLKNATANMTEVAKLNDMASDKQRVEKFAKLGLLQTQSVEVKE